MNQRFIVENQKNIKVLQVFSQNTFYDSFEKKIGFFEYFFVLVLIFYAGYSNTFVREAASIKGNFIGYVIPVGLSVVLAIKWKIWPDKRFYFLILGLAIYFLAISLKYSQIRITIFLDYFTLFVIVYVCYKVLKFNFLRIYEYWLFYLAIVGLIFWSIQFGLGGDSLFSIFSKIPGVNSFSFVSGGGLNAIVYSVQPFDYNLRNNLGSGIPRNCGYAWEPGAFAVYLSLAIFINLFITKTDKNSNTRLWVLLAALFTTQSTTGFAMLLIILLHYYYNNNVKIILMVFPVVLIGAYLILSLPFMADKIVELSDDSTNMEMTILRSINSEEQIHPQRFESFMIAFEDFKKNPMLGIMGGGPEASWTAKIGANISVISGIGNLLAQSGLAGFVFFILLTIKSSFFLSEHYKYRGKFLLFFLILFISISYSILLLPLISCFWMFGNFESQRRYKTNNKIVLFNKSANL
ncbi:hypothetical protein SAMN05444280_11188 [Tangfeifania diversioriginum]|uniref:O-Antigen ligase n=1 Tax=Tangfeifania diversioriginum TaxID=1168035 RepID=A0A1M6GR84_9BACT|nr:hypothetical protein [Tangfeifania diversioriginum]SHJ12443.1 hypothetical protein SAMN05444280_11188 [Tangfeifania diversioriginum]